MWGHTELFQEDRKEAVAKLEQPWARSSKALPALALLPSAHPAPQTHSCISAHTLKKEILVGKFYVTFFSKVKSQTAGTYPKFSKETKTINKTAILKHASAAAVNNLFWCLLSLQNCHHRFWHVKAAQWGKYSSKKGAEILQKNCYIGSDLAFSFAPPAELFTDFSKRSISSKFCSMCLGTLCREGWA